MGRITTRGTLTELWVADGTSIQGVTAGPDGKLWFTGNARGCVGRW